MWGLGLAKQREGVRGWESWCQRDKAQPEPMQEGHAQQDELCPEGGQVKGGQDGSESQEGSWERKRRPFSKE